MVKFLAPDIGIFVCPNIDISDIAHHSFSLFRSSRMRNGYFVDDVYYENKVAITDHMKRLLMACPPGTVPTKNDNMFIRSVLTNHPKWISKCNGDPDQTTVTSELSRGSRYRCIELHRVDATVMDISFHVAIHAMVPGRNNKRRKGTCGMNAFQKVARIECQDDINRAMVEEPWTCGITGESLVKKASHIDHIYEFRHLVTDFIREYAIDIDTVGYSKEPWVNKWVSEELTGQWKRYHRKNAMLRRTTPHANMSRRRHLKRSHSGHIIQTPVSVPAVQSSGLWSIFTKKSLFSPSTHQPINPSTHQPINPSTPRSSADEYHPEQVESRCVASASPLQGAHHSTWETLGVYKHN